MILYKKLVFVIITGIFTCKTAKCNNSCDSTKAVIHQRLGLTLNEKAVYEYGSENVRGYTYGYHIGLKVFTSIRQIRRLNFGTSFDGIYLIEIKDSTRLDYNLKDVSFDLGWKLLSFSFNESNLVLATGISYHLMFSEKSVKYPNGAHQIKYWKDAARFTNSHMIGWNAELLIEFSQAPTVFLRLDMLPNLVKEYNPLKTTIYKFGAQIPLTKICKK